ncbi:interleukin-1 receptor-associated kinase 1 isoform X2 [Scomber scombrus]|uniref:interleukin-1 receptor-associated kinase 1 isoform X2 n=1 Tax=Scomber scombrus TaxID=13677 RepID=UPI002DDBE0F7|nr:interleukin-1 receptor-associated kinase 1 isoform X2 [Scomber scombrus]
MSREGFRGQFLYNLPASDLWDFCQVMDGLSDQDWTRFASEVLKDQTTLRLAERRERRTDWVMHQWGIRNGRVGELLDLLECLQLLRPRDIILGCVSRMKYSLPPPPLAPAPPPPPPVRPPPSYSPSQFDPPPKASEAPTICEGCWTDRGGGEGEGGGGRGGGGGGLPPLPRPAPPPTDLRSRPQIRPPPADTAAAAAACGGGGSMAMCWVYEDVLAGTDGFSPARRVGEGGFGVVYRATLKNTECAIKRLKQDCPLDLSLLKESFQTELEKLSKFRHPNIVELLGYSEGQGSVCLIYNYMENKSLEHQLHNKYGTLSWSQRVSIVLGVSRALQFLHSPPDAHKPLIHGDVKSSNILLDCYMEAKLADFGLARFVSRGPSGRTGSHTMTFGRTETVRGTVAYLPDEYTRSGELGTAVDVYSFGVVLLEVLTGRRALEIDPKLGEIYLKSLVDEVQESPNGSSPAEWRKQLDHRLMAESDVEPVGSMEMVALACWCLNNRKKKRPSMNEVFEKLQDIHNMVRKTNSCPLPRPRPHHDLDSQSYSRQPRSLDSCVGALSQQLSRLGPLEDSSQYPKSSSGYLTPPHPLHSSSSSLPPTSCSFVGPCETDESRGFSQYYIRSEYSQFRSNGTSCTRDQYQIPSGPSVSRLSQPSVPTEDQYNFPSQISSISDRTGPAGATGAAGRPPQCVAPDRGQTAARLYGTPEFLSPAGSLQSMSPRPSEIVVNPTKQRFLEKKMLYEEGRIQTPELLSSDDLYRGESSEDFRGPEESDELDYLPSKRH